jgi:hypothetical protein
MSKAILLLILLSLAAGTAVNAQKNKKPRPRPSGKVTAKSPATAAPTATAPIIGSTVTILTKGGEQLTGEIVDLSAYSVRLKSDNLESAIPFDSIAAISFASAKALEPKSAIHPVGDQFIKDLHPVLEAFQTMTDETRTGSSYTDYDRQLIQLRRTADRFVQKFSATENPGEGRILSLLAGAIIDYNSARTIWTLKIGTDGTLSDSEMMVSDVLTLYPDLRTSSVVGNRFNADKLVGGLWKKASEKVERVRLLLKSN